MWVQSYSNTYENINKQDIWSIWTDINNWPDWNDDIEYCKLTKPFKAGSDFILKPQNGPKVTLTLAEVNPLISFTDCTHFPGAKMYGKHEMIEKDGELHLTVTMSITGPLSFIWRKLVAEKIVAKLPTQMEALVNLTKKPSQRDTS